MSEIKVNYSYHDGWSQDAAHGIQFTSTGYDGGDDYSYIAVRSINMAGKDGLHSSVFDHDYRLMTFEFQDYYNADISYGTYDGPTGDKYEVTVQFSDNTVELAKAIIQSYSDMMALFLEYALEVWDDCNYGNVSEQFNPHFITAITERYADDPSSAPWVQAPLIFAMHRDLLYDDFGGDKQKIAEYAASKSVQISPAASTPKDIQDFYTESIEVLWDDHYGPRGVVDDWFDSNTEDEKKIFYTRVYTELPEVVVADSVSEYHDSWGWYPVADIQYDTGDNYDDTSLSSAEKDYENDEEKRVDASWVYHKFRKKMEGLKDFYEDNQGSDFIGNEEFVKFINGMFVDINDYIEDNDEGTDGEVHVAEPFEYNSFYDRTGTVQTNTGLELPDNNHDDTKVYVSYKQDSTGKVHIIIYQWMLK